MSVLCELEDFYLSYTGKKGVLGLSTQGRPLYFFKVEKTAFPRIIVQYGIHAREYITTYLALEQIKEFERNGKVGTVYFIPSLNPDGVVICNTINPLFKANANSVDLNVNFNAKWGKGKTNLTKPNIENYVGKFAFCEKETIAIRDFTLKIFPQATISYHCKGEEIYYQFHQPKKRDKRDRKIAVALSKVTGYSIKNTPNSCGGYKDWCIKKLKIPAFTIEVGEDSLSHPIGKEHLQDIFIKNKNVINVVTEYLSGTKGKIYVACNKTSRKSQRYR